MMRINASGKRVVMNEEMIHKAAPSVFSDRPHSRTSEKYAFIPTMRVVNELQNQGWVPVMAREQAVREEGRQGYQRHEIRFQHKDRISRLAQVNPNAPEFHHVINYQEEAVPEIVLINSHDGLSAFRIMAGLFRQVCANGLVITDALLSTFQIRHMGYTDQAVREASDFMLDNVPQVMKKVDEYKNVVLSEQEQLALATSAAIVKWGVDMEKLPFSPETLIRSRRVADDGANLWNTFNRVQENIIRGGIRYLKVNQDLNTGRRQVRRMRTKEVKSVGEDIRINRALWLLAENMRRLKAGEQVIAEREADTEI